MRRFIIIILILFGIFAAGIGYLVFKDNKKSAPLDSAGNNSENTSNNSANSNNPSVPASDFTTSAWIPYWDYSRGLNTLKANKGKFNSISPVIYELNKNGSLKKTKGDTYIELQNYAKQNGIKFIPTIAMFDHELFTPILQNDDNRTRHINAVLEEIESNNYDGIDLDYESTKLTDKEKYFDMIKRIRTGIDDIETRKNVQLTFSITVLAQWGDETYYPSLRETRQVQDWKELSKYADEIRIMAYDYTSQYSTEPGPIAPLPWIDEVMKKATDEIPKEKIILSLHNYAYNWASAEVDPNVDFENNPPGEKIKADAFTYDKVLEIKAKYKGTDSNDMLWSEHYYSYKKDGASRIMIYVDKENIIERTDIAKRYGIKGVCFWRLGGDSKLGY